VVSGKGGERKTLWLDSSKDSFSLRGGQERAISSIYTTKKRISSCKIHSSEGGGKDFLKEKKHDCLGERQAW